VNVLELLSGGLGLAIIAAAVLMALVLEVLDQLAATPDEDSPISHRSAGPAGRGLRIALVVLVAASVIVTFVRIFVVVR
jgi:hypothetical protein